MSGKKQSDLIVPAVNGTKFVLNAASKCSSVKGVVLTSSFVAVQEHKYDKLQHTYDESDWSEIENSSAYYKSKTLAEKEAWKMWGDLDESNRFKLATMLPGFVIGPQRVNTEFQSATLICEILKGKYPSIPNLYIPVVHVADVAKAHILAMENFEVANGNRFITIEKTYHLKEIFGSLQEFRKYGYKVPTGSMKKCTFGVVSVFIPKVRHLKKVWGRKINGDNKKIKEVLGMEFQQCEDGVMKMGYQCIKKGLIVDKTKGEAQQKQVL